MTEARRKRELAGRVEAWLGGEGIALTMGGEPTFIPGKPLGEEWNTGAMGPEKLGYARRMAAELLAGPMAGGLVMQVFGKWYPGEPLPRWNVLVLRDPEGSPLWHETGRLLLDDVGGGNGRRAADRLMRRLASRLGLGKAVFPGADAVGGRARRTGYVLPLDFADGAWVTGDWGYSGKQPVPLVPGDSPMGLRLPLSALPDRALKRALTVEVRDGALEIFFPPLPLNAFRELTALVQDAVCELELGDIVLCGYAPDGPGADTDEADLVRFGLAADPGVLEANLPPCRSWAEFDRVLRLSVKAADAVGLGTTRVELNGAVHGTGGGSHLAFGGPSMAENPFLEKPARIASVLRYWQHHPALSYLFAGRYFGSGCQAPRIDEGPLHGLHELEVACEGLEQLPAPAEGEIVDGFLRNLMTDSSGNTHRAEICFDKFGNPSAPNGRLGIIELRAFETFDSVASLSVVALFIRTILARLMRTPFRRQLRRFGPVLHDTYFLPHFIWADIGAICADLEANGFAFDPEWLRPVFEFRCPGIGALEVPGGRVEVRQAFEPWPLMAEESRGSATARVVDNSSDRLQVLLSDPGLLGRGALLVNGVELPLQAAGEAAVCGLRYKCASAWPALHPHVPIQSPLLFEWIDRQTGKVRAAAHYHFWNPKGPVYDGPPKDSREAARRRKERWRPAPGRVGQRPPVAKPRRSPEYQSTLDLRRQCAT